MLLLKVVMYNILFKTNVRIRGTAKGWAKAWKAEPQVICQGAM